MNERISQALGMTGAESLGEKLRDASWSEFRGFFSELFRDTEVETQVLRDLDGGRLRREYNGVVIATVLSAAIDGKVKVSGDGLSNLGRFLRLLEVGDSDAFHMRTGLVAKGRVEVSGMPAEYMQAIDASTASQLAWLHHIYAVSVMKPGIPYSYIAALGEKHPPLIMVALYAAGVPAEYVAEYRANRWSDGPRMAATSEVPLLAAAYADGIAGAYLGTGLKMGMEPPDIWDAVADGIAFEYLAAYYEDETA